jgi:hypothetical protein
MPERRPIPRANPGTSSAATSASVAAPTRRTETWVAAAWAVLALEVALAIYLGQERPGLGPVRAYTWGLPLLALLALLVGAVGLVRSAFRRPFLRPERVVAFSVLGIVIASTSYSLPFPSYRAERPSSVAVELPSRSEWTVAWGGEHERNAMLRTRPDRCFAFLLVRVVAGATRAAGDPRSAFAFDEEVLAPCDGTLVRVLEDLADDGRGPDDLGNHLVLEIAPAEYLFLANLKQASVLPELGAKVARGEPLARVGFSTATTLITPEPHLGIHLQDSPVPFEGQGIPFSFHRVLLDGRPLETAAPVGRGLFAGRAPEGSRIAPAP